MKNMFEFNIVYFFYIVMFVIVVKMGKEGYFKGFLKAFFQEIISKRYFILTFFIVISIIMKFFDQNIAIYFKSIEGNNNFLDILARFGNTLGQGEYLFSALITFSMVASILKKKKLEKIFNLSLISSALIGLLNQIPKSLIIRQRPYVEYNSALIFAYKRAFSEGRLIASVYDSLPSGHTISITGASIIIALYCNNKYLKFFFFFLPLIGAFGRVYTQYHWLSDVITAYLLGTIFAISFYKLNKDKILNN